MPSSSDNRIATKPPQKAEVIIVGGGCAGLSAAIYLGREERDALVIDTGKSMARWEPEVQNYLGFSNGISGEELLQQGREQVKANGVPIMEDEVLKAGVKKDGFVLQGKVRSYHAKRLLLATGIFHLPPEIPEATDCVGESVFFCKDCDGLRVRGKQVAVYGRSNDTVEYALGMLYYSPCVIIVTDGKRPQWDRQHTDWIEEYKIPVYLKPITGVRREGCQVKALLFGDGMEVEIDALFSTIGDVYLNKLARGLGAEVDEQGEVLVNSCMRTSVPGLYAAGCVTPANCQMIIAAGQGATAAQAINRDLFEESLATHSLRHFRGRQLQTLKATGVAKDRKALVREIGLK